MTKLKVYLQALGAHFLGENAYNAHHIKIELVYTKGTVNVPYIVTKNDGNNSSKFATGACSFMPIITVPISGEASVCFLSHNTVNTSVHTSCGIADIEPPSNIELAHLAISVPTTIVSEPMLLLYPVLLNPTQSEYAVTVAIPGLYLSLPPQQTNNTISVLVKMMCGCPVTMGPPASLWPANDFTVNAYVVDSSGKTTKYLLTYDANQTGKSLFSSPLSPDQKQIQSVTFTASQKSTGNCGALV
jgi:hypothetical protein